jgi:hypothetical protein
MYEELKGDDLVRNLRTVFKLQIALTKKDIFSQGRMCIWEGKGVTEGAKTPCSHPSLQSYLLVLLLA